MSVQPKAILFDLDNTLIDRSKSLVGYVTHFHERFSNWLPSVSPTDLIKAFQVVDKDGYISRELMFGRLLKKLVWQEDPPLLATLVADWQTFYPLSVEPVNDLEHTLTVLQATGLKLGIISNGPSSLQNAKLDRLNLRPFMELILISEEVGLRKPDRRIFTLAIKMLGLEPGQVWFVGDNIRNDILGASRAGLTPIWIVQDRERVKSAQESRIATCQILAITDLPSLIHSA